MQKIRDACPTEEQCVADEDECLRLHPIHMASTVGGVIDMVYAEVGPLVALILDEVWPTNSSWKQFSGNLEPENQPTTKDDHEPGKHGEMGRSPGDVQG